VSGRWKKRIPGYLESKSIPGSDLNIFGVAVVYGVGV
ncbi:hypothetical protein U0070_008361, partial [Myodes glareolus]